MKHLKRIIALSYIALVVIMAVATFVENSRGSDYASSYIYSSTWFVALWALLAASAVAYIIKRRMRHASAILLHTALAGILLGALVTHISSKSGRIHLREGQPTDTLYVDCGIKGVTTEQLPFTVRLNKFNVNYHDGTMAASDYESQFDIIDGTSIQQATVSMNNIFTYRDIRFYQSSYDEDMHGSILSVNSDPYGIPITYFSYALLFISLILMLIDPKGAYRKVFRSDALRRGVMCIAVLFGFSLGSNAAHTLPRSTADEFGHLYVLWNNRVCPMQTFAIDFTKKLCGHSSYKGYTAEQVLLGFIFWGDEWSSEPIIKLKRGGLRDVMMLPEYVSVNTFFSHYGSGYTLGSYLQEYYQGQRDAFHKQVADIDDRLQLIMQLRQGLLLKMFPYTHEGTTVWHSPTEKLDTVAIEASHRMFIQNVFLLIYQDVLAEHYGQVDYTLKKISKYQQQNAATSLPTATQTTSERTLNRVPFATILFMLNLTVGLVMLIVVMLKLTNRRIGQSRWTAWLHIFGTMVMVLSFIALSLCLALRWQVSGAIPMSNGYETMLLIAWLIMLCTLIMVYRFKIVLTFGFLMSGFALLVSHINQMNPAITPLMPVLNSPLLSLHVSIIMTAFALLSLTFICSLMTVVLMLVPTSDNNERQQQISSLHVLSQVFLYPAMTALGIGIFIGAIWANVSWGSYWSWDSKEVWALIVFMIYAIPLHPHSIPLMQRPRVYHVFMTVAFMTVLMTYFGVNYLLTGMHSYA